MSWNRPAILIGIIALLLALGWLRMQPEEEQQLRRSQLLMGTVVEIVAYGKEQHILDKAMDEAFAEMVRLDKLLSRHYRESDVSRLSRQEKGGKVAPETAEIIALGLDVARQSHGAFDMTLGRLKTLWGLGEDNPTVPGKQAIAEAITGIGPYALTLNRDTVIKNEPALMVDLGGIAKGYAVDRAVAILERYGIPGAAVNAGGDMYLLGQHPQRPWRIGIQHPRKQDAILVTVEIRDKAVVTSGDYERFFEVNGQRYHHIFNPQTGMPAQDCQSVTVIAENVALGDALATALFVLGPQAGLELLNHYPGNEGMIIAADGSKHSSPGWKDYLIQP